MYWLNRSHRFSRELHFDNRVSRCIAERPASLFEMFNTVVESCPDSDAVVAADTRLSYRQLQQEALKCAAVMRQLGVEPGDRVVLNLGNSHEFAVVFLACLALGAIAVPVGTRQRAPELEYIYNNCGARAVYYDRDSAAVQPQRSIVPSVRFWFSCSAAGQSDSIDFSASQAAAVALAHSLCAVADEEDCAAILYTSGTTGRPKGAMLTHLGLIHTVLHWTTRFELHAGERTIVNVPISHVTGLGAQLLVMFSCGGCTIMQREFKVDEFLDLAERERLSYQIMVPAMYKLLLLRANLSSRELSCWRIGAFGGAPMPQATITQMAAAIPHLLLANGYGATETSSPSTMMPLPACRNVLDSIGTAVDCCDLVVMDDRGHEVMTGQSGEIWLAGPHVIPRYWNSEDANNTAFVGGYWRSGDIGSVDEAGFVRIFDRKKDMINRGGYKIFSAEVENVISDHSAVDDVALVPVPCEVLGQRCCAVIYASATEPRITHDQLVAFLRDRVADYKIPDFLLLQEQMLPRNANGKIQKNLLRQQAEKMFSPR